MFIINIILCERCGVQVLEETEPIFVVELKNDSKDIDKIWTAARYRCPTCGTLIIAGLKCSQMPESEIENAMVKIKKSKTPIVYWRKLDQVEEERVAKRKERKSNGHKHIEK